MQLLLIYNFKLWSASPPTITVWLVATPRSAMLSSYYFGDLQALTGHLHLRKWSRQYHNEPACEISRSKVISVQKPLSGQANRHTHTHTHTGPGAQPGPLNNNIRPTIRTRSCRRFDDVIQSEAHARHQTTTRNTHIDLDVVDRRDRTCRRRRVGLHASHR